MREMKKEGGKHNLSCLLTRNSPEEKKSLGNSYVNAKERKKYVHWSASAWLSSATP